MLTLPIELCDNYCIVMYRCVGRLYAVRVCGCLCLVHFIYKQFNCIINAKPGQSLIVAITADRSVDIAEDSDDDPDYSSQDDGSDSEPMLEDSQPPHRLHHHHHRHHHRQSNRAVSLPPTARVSLLLAIIGLFL